ncbi:PREDICTED: photosystem II 5 kDa protein, chloroplastic [Nelumbo nucifera]|uniref:Photosystem II 5 kDa protein, chloroplastic-like n=2 Tax=Nelumbo nucifera TaxID=4432 RepID=A0A822ZF53_NELNU|nr:PREDICTED: photosystem II 5 kDa protein, chloroplastic [Nelumbo nucifera]DAD42380.1 TPA_asm: hypothetical protein HUJ06_000610 [Nelumbo nucifera]DAD42381.1 TPA_asm: hypothetical protein HUJ06_000611 [Nelumbo nucifera]
MASVTMTASFLGGITASERISTTSRRGLIVAKAARAADGKQVKLSCTTNTTNNNDKGSSNGRRDLMFAAAAAAVYSIAGVAVAEDPKIGTPEALKKYAPICVTMPTARVCHK